MNRAHVRGCAFALMIGLCSSACNDDAGKDTTGDAMQPSTREDAGVDASEPPEEDASAEMDGGTSDPSSDASADAAAGDAAGDALAPDAVVVFPATPDASARVQDTREFTFTVDMARFDALPGATVETDRFFGTYEGGAYRMEIPKSWNGKLVAYAHGYVGPVPALRVTTPSIRRHLIEQGYAWVASSYSRNYYDVRVGVEDTNKLVLDFVKIAKQHGRELSEPSKRYIIGHSMGGHVTAAAIEKEAAETARNKVQYDAALPMCGVMGDTELFNYFASFQIAAQHLAGMPVTAWPEANFASKRMPLQMALFSMYPKTLTEAGTKLRGVVMNLTGGKRPAFELGFASMGGQEAVWGTFGGDGTIAGILERNVIDTREAEYQLDELPAVSAEEMTLNTSIYRVTPAADANGLRPDGLRFIPQINGEIGIKVLSLHTLGDLYVPFKMQQIYRQRVEAKGNGDKLVQRAIRAVSHCEFTYAEQTAAFDALIAWSEGGAKPDGDDVLTPSVLADPNYGCKFTSTAYTQDEMTAGTLPAARAALPACPAP